MKFFKNLNFKKVMAILLVFLNVLCPNIAVSAITHIYELYIPIVGDSGVGKTTIFNNLKKYGEISRETENSYCLRYADEFGRIFNMNFYDINIDLDKDVDKTNFSCQKLNTILPQMPQLSLIVFDYGNEATLSEERITLWKDVMKTKSPTSSIMFLPNKKDLLTEEQKQNGTSERPARLTGKFEHEGKEENSRYPTIHQDYLCLTLTKFDDGKIAFIFNKIWDVLSYVIGSYNIKPIEYYDSGSVSKQKTEISEEERTHQTTIDRILRSEKIHQALNKIILSQKAQSFSKEQIDSSIAEIFKVSESWPPEIVQVSGSSSSSSSSETFTEGKFFNTVILNMPPIRNNFNQSIAQMLNNGYTFDEIEETILRKLNQWSGPKQSWWEKLPFLGKIMALFKPRKV